MTHANGRGQSKEKNGISIKIFDQFRSTTSNRYLMWVSLMDLITIHIIDIYEHNFDQKLQIFWFLFSLTSIIIIIQ